MCSVDWGQSGFVMSLVFIVETVGKRKAKEGNREEVMIVLMSNRRKNTAHLWMIWLNPNRMLGSSPMADSTPESNKHTSALVCGCKQTQIVHRCIMKCLILHFTAQHKYLHVI